MKDTRSEIVVVWFKRDLRFIDHEPILLAQKVNLPQLFVYCFEPSVMNYADSDHRHWRFVYESLQDLQQQLKSFNARIAIFHQEAFFVFQSLHAKYKIRSVFSHQEIGNKLTYDRDLCIKKYLHTHQIEWYESPHNGVIRKLQSRKNGSALWNQKMQLTPALVNLKNTKFLNFDL